MAQEQVSGDVVLPVALQQGPGMHEEAGATPGAPADIPPGEVGYICLIFSVWG